MKTINDLQSPEYTLVQHDGDVLELNSEFNTEYDGFIVKVGDGEYLEVYGYFGAIPWNDKEVTRVK